MTRMLFFLSEKSYRESNAWSFRKAGKKGGEECARFLMLWRLKGTSDVLDGVIERHHGTMGRRSEGF